MKVKQVSTNIWKLSIWLGVPISVWVVKEDDGVTLVDTGIVPMGKGILEQLELLKLGPLQRILLTHGHPDHVGAIERLRAHRDVPVYAHALEIPYMEGELPYPRRSKANVLVRPELAEAFVEEQGELISIGSLKPYLTPGHSPGHTVFYHEEDDVLLGGDILTSSRSGRLRRPIPMFTADMAQAIESAGIVKELEPAVISLCHGRDVADPHKQYDIFFDKWKNKYSL